MPAPDPHRGARGSVLVLAVWSLSLLAVLAGSLGYGVRQRASLIVRMQLRGDLARAAWAGVEKARGLMKMTDATPGLDTLAEDWSNNPSEFQDVPFGQVRFSVGYPVPGVKKGEAPFIYGLVDEERKINLNTADAETITRLLQAAAGLGSDRAQEIAYAIIDWRDTDSVHQHAEYGAEDDDYENLAKPYEAKDKPMDALEELLLVKGMKREIFDRIRDDVTVVGGGAVNINTASARTLQALGLGKDLVEKILLYRRGVDGVERTTDDQYFSSAAQITAELKKIFQLDITEEAALDQLASAGRLTVFSSYFTVTSRAVVQERWEITARAVIDRDGKIYYSRISQVSGRSEATHTP